MGSTSPVRNKWPGPEPADKVQLASCFDESMIRRSRKIAIAVTGLALVAAGTAAAVAAPAGVGAQGGGDPYFPRQGNGGYDVSSYTLRVGYVPDGHQLTGAATIRARATQDLGRFDLDLRRRMHVTSVMVDGAAARFAQPASKVQELVVFPAAPLAAGDGFTVHVSYGGVVAPVIDPDGSLDGWTPTQDGAFVASEPQGSPSWFPVNDSPYDKATYRVSVTVPAGLTAVSNGRLLGTRTRGDRVTWNWALNTPVSSYLVTATVGRFNLDFGTTGGGVPYINAVDPSQQAASTPVLAKLPAMVDYFSSVYGPYPFESVGAIVDYAPRVGYALETATRPVFDSAPDELTLAHELAHQWYGDDVTLLRWRDIWLNEGFAEFSDWLWDEHTGGQTAAERLARLMSRPADAGVWNPPPGNPGSGAEIFADSVYERGAGTLQALRQRVGDPVFFRIMRGWVRVHAYNNATVDEFTAYAARISGRDLTGFFHQWLYRHGKPYS